MKQNIADNFKKISEVIEEQSNLISYSKPSQGSPIKIFVYKAFFNTLKKFPQEMSGYLSDTNINNYGLQSKIFQEYINVLEGNIPFSFKKNKKMILVSSILDESITPFYGISKFNSTVGKNGIIKNETKEIYIGNRKSYYCHPYYIGKLLDVINVDGGHSLLNDVKEYSFSLIKTNIPAFTNVIVSHLRIPSHYQMGILSHINRIKKHLTTILVNERMHG